jgi:hypothetical protein
MRIVTFQTERNGSMPQDGKMPPEMVQFMGGIKEALEKLIGERGKVAIGGDASNGIFCVVMSIEPIPNIIIITECMGYVIEMLKQELMRGQELHGQTPDKVM